MKKKNFQPIFISSLGRAGSTVFYKMFSEHESVSFLNPVTVKKRGEPSAHRKIMKLLDFPVLGNYLKKHIKPTEGYQFWDYYFKGFSKTFRDLNTEDITIKAKTAMHADFPKMTTRKRNKLLLKITGWPRIEFLKGVFKDSRFIYIVRDARAFVNSILEVDWWKGWQGPTNWRFGELSEENQMIFKKYNYSFIALAAIQWNIVTDCFINSFSNQDKNIMVIKYEDLIEDPKKYLKESCEFIGLEYSRNFQKKIKKNYSLVNKNIKWQKDLTPEQNEIIEKICNKNLHYFGYL